MKHEKLQRKTPTEYNLDVTGMDCESFFVVVVYCFLKALSIIHQKGKQETESVSPVTFKER